MSDEATTPAPAAPAVVPAEVVPAAPEKTLSPVERAAKRFDEVKAQAEERAKAAAAAKPPETPPAAATASETPAGDPPKSPEEPLSTKFAQVAKLERQAREALKSAKAKEAALEKERADWKAKLDAAEQAKANAKLNIGAYLEQAGLTYDDVAQFQLNGLKPTAELTARSVQDEVNALKKQRAEEIRLAAEAEQRRSQEEHNQRYSAWSASVVDYVKANKAKYELINQQGRHELVPQVIQKRFEESQTVLTEAEAADLVEKHLEEEAEKLLSVPKLAARLKPAVAVQPVVAQPRTTTLSNGLTASASSVNGHPKSMTAEAKMERARLAMENARKT